MNLVETGHTSCRQDHQLSIISAVYDDIISRMMQNGEYEEFMEGNV